MAHREKQKILLVEDENRLRKGIRLNLEAEGYTVTEYANADAALNELRAPESDRLSFPDFDLGILDIMMPGAADGLELCRRLRDGRHYFPLIFLSARNGVDDRIAGLAAGADDYLTKPFDLSELLARVAASLRRNQWDAREEGNPPPTFIGEVRIDLANASAHSPAGEVFRFNEREFAILQLLLEHRGRPVSRDQILDRVWGTAEYPSNRTIDNYIVKFRKIFEAEPQAPRYIITRHGTGYELANN